MKKLFLISSCFAVLAFSGCKKNDTTPPVETPVTELDVLTDFANVVVNPNYEDARNHLAIASQARP